MLSIRRPRAILKVLIATIIAASTVSPAHAKSPHNKGCNTNSCDVRTDRAYTKKHRKHPMTPAIASWYQDAGQTASGTHYTLGVAHKTLAFGQRIRMCAQRCATVRVEDRGPFIAGRDFDLNWNAKQALGCGDICYLRYRLLY